MIGGVAGHKGRGGRLSSTRDHHHRAADSAVFLGTSSRSLVEHVHDGASELVAIFDQLAVFIKVKRLEEEAEASLDEHFISVEAE